MLFGDFIFRKNKCLKKKVKVEETDYKYDDVRMNFQSDYDRTNPVTKDKALEDWVKYIESKKKNVNC
jgi:hypothetical protein